MQRFGMRNPTKNGVSGRHPHRPQNALEVGGQRGGNVQDFSRMRVGKDHGRAVQQQSPAIEVIADEAVVRTVAVRGVADDGMEDVLHVAAQLVLAAGMWSQFE